MRSPSAFISAANIAGRTQRSPQAVSAVSCWALDLRYLSRTFRHLPEHEQKKKKRMAEKECFRDTPATYARDKLYAHLGISLVVSDVRLIFTFMCTALYLVTSLGADLPVSSFYSGLPYFHRSPFTRPGYSHPSTALYSKAIFPVGHRPSLILTLHLVGTLLGGFLTLSAMLTLPRTLRTALRPLHHPFPLTFPSHLHLHPHLFPSRNGMARRIFMAPRASVAMFCGGFSVIGLPVSCTCTLLGACTSLTGRPGARFGGGRTHARVQPVGSIQARSSDTGARRLSPDCTGYCRSLLAVRRPPVRPNSGHMPYGHSHPSCSSHPTHLLGSLQLLTRAMANHANPWFADVDTDSFHLAIRPRPFSSFRRPLSSLAR